MCSDERQELHLLLGDACRFVNACYYLLLALVAEYEPENNQHDDAGNGSSPAISVEWDAEHAEAENEGDILLLLVLLINMECFVDTPDN